MRTLEEHKQDFKNGKRLATPAAGILAWLVIVVLVLSSCGVNDDYQQQHHGDWLKTHPYSIGQTTLFLTDSLRNRPLKTEVWYPTSDTTKANNTSDYPFQLPPTSKDADIIDGTFPLILFSHGTGGNRISQMWLAVELVGRGYIVAAVDHFGNTLDNKIPEQFVRIWERPLDVRFVLDELLSNPKLNPHIDTSKIGMTGFSLGGYTAIALAGGHIDYNVLHDFSATDEGIIEFTLPELGNISHLLTESLLMDGERHKQALQDTRIKAFVALAPALGQGFTHPHQTDPITAPLLIIGAQGDERTPIETNAKHLHELIGHSEFIELKGHVGHYVFMNVASAELRNHAPLIFKDHSSVIRTDVHRMVSDTLFNFFERTLSRNP